MASESAFYNRFAVTARSDALSGLAENKKIRMVLSGVHLLFDRRNMRLIISDHDKQILNDKTVFSIFVDNLHMRQMLLVRADFILTFDNEDAAGL